MTASDGTPFWRMDDPEMDGGRIVTGGMWRHQREWWELPNFVKLLVGGYGSGKSQLLCKRAISTCLMNAPVPSLIVSPTYRMARDTIVETLLELLDGKRELLGQAFSYTWNKSEFNFQIRDHSQEGRLLVRNGDDPARLKGSNIACAYIDEPFIQDVAVLEQVAARCRHPEAKLLEIGLGGTPEQLNWGFDLAEGELGKQFDVGLVRASTFDNRALPSDYAERLSKGYTEKMVEAFVHGKFVSTAEGLIYSRFDPEHHLTDDDTPPEGGEPFVGMDFNVNPMAFVLGYRTGSGVYIHDERELPNADTIDACEEIRRCWPMVSDVYPDPTGRARKTSSRSGNDFVLLEDAGFMVHAPYAPWPRRDRYAAVNDLMRRNAITIGPRCTRLRRAVSQMTYDIENKPSGKSLSHVLDAMGYPIAFMFPVTSAMSGGDFVEMPA